jgi:hypothetical protein
MNKNSKNESDARMDLEAWAVLSATVEFFPAERRGEVLERLGHAPDAWRKLSLAGNVAVFAAVDAGDVHAVARYGRMLDETKRRLAAEKTTVEGLGPLLGDDMLDNPLADTLEMPPRVRANAAAHVPVTEDELEDEMPPTRRSGTTLAPLSSPARPIAPTDLEHPVLTLQQYACLRAEIVDARDSAAILRIHHCYGLDARSDAAEARAWGERFTDRDLFRQYKTLFDYYRAVLMKRCG